MSQQYGILQNAPSASTPENAAALRFVIHFLGDMHQPLQIATNNDRGGNCVPVKYGSTTPKLAHGKYAPELHGVWDDNLVDAAMQAANKSDVGSYAAFLAGLATQNQVAWSPGSAPDWMAATHSIAETVGYGELQANRPIPNLVSAIAGLPTLQSCSDGHYDRSLFEKHLAVTTEYINDATPQVQDQWAKGGLRLANMLNALCRDGKYCLRPQRHFCPEPVFAIAAQNRNPKWPRWGHSDRPGVPARTAKGVRRSQRPVRGH